ncbi:MAG: hypothetical protein AB7S39_10475 [Gemmatimonadales bacterium]
MRDRKKQASRGAKRPSRGGKGYDLTKAEHQVTHAVARRMRKRFIGLFGADAAFARPAAYGRQIFDKILAQDGVVGIRFYPGISDKGDVTLLFCGVDSKGNDVLKGVIGDNPLWCPPFCSDENEVLQF